MARRLRDYPQVGVRIEDLAAPLDFEKIFGRTAAVHIEIGSGKGTFLLGQGRARPDVNFLGIEWARKYYLYAVDRIGRWGLTNVKFIRTDAVDFIVRFIGDRSVACYHIYYPDPWPKRRHHKRRFICARNLEHFIRTLSSGGTIQIATDHAGYFEQIKKVLTEYGDALEPTDFTPAATAEPGEIVATNYERKYSRENRDVYTIAVKRIG
jgi:tRNA (guanine-N7-)-methyltransferase